MYPHRKQEKGWVTFLWKRLPQLDKILWAKHQIKSLSLLGTYKVQICLHSVPMLRSLVLPPLPCLIEYANHYPLLTINLPSMLYPLINLSRVKRLGKGIFRYHFNFMCYIIGLNSTHIPNLESYYRLRNHCMIRKGPWIDNPRVWRDRKPSITINQHLCSIANSPSQALY